MPPPPEGSRNHFGPISLSGVLLVGFKSSTRPPITPRRPPLHGSGGRLAEAPSAAGPEGVARESAHRASSTLRPGRGDRVHLTRRALSRCGCQEGRGERDNAARGRSYVHRGYNELALGGNPPSPERGVPEGLSGPCSGPSSGGTVARSIEGSPRGLSSPLAGGGPLLLMESIEPDFFGPASRSSSRLWVPVKRMSRLSRRAEASEIRE